MTFDEALLKLNKVFNKETFEQLHKAIIDEMNRIKNNARQDALPSSDGT